MKTTILFTTMLLSAGSLMMSQAGTEPLSRKSNTAPRVITAAKRASSKPVAPMTIVIDKRRYELTVYDALGWFATYPVVFGNNTLDDKKMEGVYSKRIRAGKRRTYFFDVRSTRGNDYYLTITESRKRFNDDGYDRHKIFLYKEDFNKFIKALGEAIDYVKTELMPDFDFDAFNHEYNDVPEETATAEETIEITVTPPTNHTSSDDVDKW